MKHFIPGILSIAAVVVWLVPGAEAGSTSQQQKDSLRRIVAHTEGADRMQARTQLAGIYRMDIRMDGSLDSLLILYDAMEAEAREAGDTKTQGLIMNNRLSAYYNARQLDELIGKAPAALAFLERNGLWKDYYQSCLLLTDAWRLKRDFERALEEAEKFYSHAKGREDRAGMGLAQLALSKIYAAQRRFAEAETCMRECIGQLQDETPYLNYLATAYNNLASNLIGQERYDEALQVACAAEGVNRRYEETSHAPQPSAWYNLWLTYTDIYRQTGDYDKAQFYVDRIDSITKGSVRMYKERGHILYGKKRYTEALEMLDSAIRNFPNSLEPKALKLMTLAQMRESEEAVKLFSDVIGELEARRNEAFNARLDEVRTQYEVDKYIAEKERNRNYFLFALGGCGLLVLLLVVACYYNRVITRKNIGLYNRIKEQDRVEKELARLQALAVQKDGRAPAEAAVKLPGDRQQRELVERLHEYLLSGRSFVRAEMNRDEIVSALGTNKNNLSEAVKAVTGKTPMEYIRTVQLEEARQLLDKHPELTVEAIAFDCGFNALNTFYRLFRKHYGISPAEYRKIADSIGR